MQYGIRLLEQAIEKVGEHFSVAAWEQQPQCVGRARSQAVPLKAHHLGPHITTTRYRPVIQYSDGKLSVPNECVLNNCASLYMFCNAFQVKM